MTRTLKKYCTNKKNTCTFLETVSTKRPVTHGHPLDVLKKAVLRKSEQRFFRERSPPTGDYVTDQQLGTGYWLLLGSKVALSLYIS